MKIRAPRAPQGDARGRGWPAVASHDGEGGQAGALGDHSPVVSTMRKRASPRINLS